MYYTFGKGETERERERERRGGGDQRSVLFWFLNISIPLTWCHPWTKTDGEGRILMASLRWMAFKKWSLFVSFRRSTSRCPTDTGSKWTMPCLSKLVLFSPLLFHLISYLSFRSCAAISDGQDGQSKLSSEMPEMIREWERAFLQTLMVCMIFVILANRRID